MVRRSFATVAFCVIAASAAAQSVTTLHAPSGLPASVVEMAGGDVEHIAVALPPGAVSPATIAGFPVTAHPRRGGGVFTLTVPAPLSAQVLDETLKALVTTGSAAVVLLGPTPVRELAAAGDSLGAVPFRPEAPPQCILAEGGVELRRGSHDLVTLDLALPGPGDPRFDLLPTLAAWIQGRLVAAFPDLRVTVDESTGCSRLHITAEPDREPPRALLARLRTALAQLAVTPPTADEVSSLGEAVRLRLAVMARDGGATAVRLADRLAHGGNVAAAVAVPEVEAGTITALAAALLAGHPGSAVITEAERRALPASPQTMDNGVVISTSWVAGDIAVLAVALGGVDPAVGAALLAEGAHDAAKRGWVTDLGEQAGVPTLSVAVPGGDVVAALELLSDVLGGSQSPPLSGLDADVGHALGLAPRPASESVSLALALPEESEEGPEAAMKFFSTLTSGGVRVAAAAPPPGLNWAADEGIPEVAALIDLPPSTEGLLAGVVVATRLGAQPRVTTRWLAPAGRLVLEVRGRGDDSVPALDSRLAGLWKGVRGALRPGEEETAARTVEATFFGDPTKATARTAATVFLPVAPRIESVLGADLKEVSAVLTSLPAWDAITRLARGPAPPPPTPVPHRTVRKSRPSRP